MRLVSIICLLVLVSCATSYEDAKRTMRNVAKCEYAAYLKSDDGSIQDRGVCFQTLRDNVPNYCAMRMIDLEDETYWNEVTRNYRIEGDCDADKIMTIVRRDRIMDLLVNYTQTQKGNWHTIQDTHKIAIKFEDKFKRGNR